MIDFKKLLEPNQLDDPKRWAPCNRPLSPAEVMYLFNVQESEPAQERFPAVRVDEEVGVGKPELSVSFFSEQT